MKPKDKTIPGDRIHSRATAQQILGPLRDCWFACAGLHLKRSPKLMVELGLSHNVLSFKPA